MSVGCSDGIWEDVTFPPRIYPLPHPFKARQASPNLCHSVGTCPPFQALWWCFHSSFLLMACFAHHLHSVVLPEGCLSPPLPCFPTEFSGHCSAALAQRSEYVIWACPSSSPCFHSPGTTHLVCNHKFLSTLPPVTNISNSKAFSHTGWKQWPFALDWLCLQLFILFLHVKGLAKILTHWVSLAAAVKGQHVQIWMSKVRHFLHTYHLMQQPYFQALSTCTCQPL